MQRDIFSSISPLDGRYYRSSRKLLDSLSLYLSENSLIRYEARVEAAIITVMERRGIVEEGAGSARLPGPVEPLPSAVDGSVG